MLLHLFQKAWKLVDINPYAMKVDTFMRLNNLKYQTIHDQNASSAPRGELPYLEDGDLIIGDSSQIISYLISTYKLPIDDSLNEYQRGIEICVKRLFEEHLYPIMLYGRMVDEAGLTVFSRDIFKSKLREEQIKVLSNKFKQKLIERGIGKYSQIEIYKQGIENIKAIERLIGNNKFFFGDNVHSIDALVYAFIANIREVPIDTPLNEKVASSKILMNYCNNIAILL